MLGLPKSTEYNRRIPKQKFYEKIDISPLIKKSFIEQIKTIYWKNKIAVSTINLAAGRDVTEIELFEIRLNRLEFDIDILRQIDKGIPYHILFIIEYKEKYQAWIGFKEIDPSSNKVVTVSSYYHTDWLNEDELPLKVDGFDMDGVYENFVRQIAGDKLDTKTKEETLKQSVERQEQKHALQKQLKTLKAKIRKEKQLNKQICMNDIVKKINKKLEDL